jgi:hypothetical protein
MSILHGLPKPEHYSRTQAFLSSDDKVFKEIEAHLKPRTKQFQVFKNAILSPGIPTNALTFASNHGNVHTAKSDINKKIKQFGLELKDFKRFGIAQNADFYHWYLIYTDKVNLDTTKESANEPIYQ